METKWDLKWSLERSLQRKFEKLNSKATFIELVNLRGKLALLIRVSRPGGEGITWGEIHSGAFRNSVRTL